MRRPVILLSACLMLAPAAFAAPGPAVGQTGANITVDDLLKAETLGDVWFSPDGKRVMFVRGMPVDDVKVRTQDDEAIDRDRVMTAELAGGAPAQIGDFAPIHAAPWSPDGSGALMLWVKDGAYGLTYWNAASGQTQDLPGRVASSFPTFAWAGDRLFYGVVGDGDIQRGARAQLLERLAPKWREAWTGDQPEVSVMSTDPLFKATKPPVGKLMMADVKAGHAIAVAEGDFEPFGLQVSPDGRWLVAVRLAGPLDQSINWYSRRGELQIFDLRGGGAVLAHSFSDLDFADAGLAWSARGDRLLIGAKAADAPRASAGIYEVDAASGQTRRLAGGDLSFLDTSVMAGAGFMPMGWIGDRPVAIAARAGQSGPEAPRAGIGSDYGENAGLRFDLYDLSGPAPRALTGFAHASVRSFLATRERSDALVVADGALWKVDPAASAPARLTPQGLGMVAGFAVDARYPLPAPETAYHRDAAGERVSLLVAAAPGDIEREVFDLASGQVLAKAPVRSVLAAAPDLLTVATKTEDRWATAYALTTPHGDRPLITVDEALNVHPVAPIERFNYVYQGKTLTGWVLLPPDAKPGVPLPAIVSVYGGSVYGSEPPTLSKPSPLLPQLNGQFLAAHGYAVIYPSTPLGQGADTDVMKTLADECIAAVDALAAKGVVDPKRVGVTGQSFGGFSTAAILAVASNRFRAGVAMAGIYDWSFSWGVPSMNDMLSYDSGDTTVETKMVEEGQIQLHKPVWDSPEAYLRNSPLDHVEAINSPLLLLHGDLDMAVTGLPNATRMYDAMVRAGKDAALVRYWGEGHVSRSAWAMRDQADRILAWFDAYVKGERPARAPGPAT